MSDLLVGGLLLCQTVLFAVLDRKLHGGWLTPFSCLAVPYTVITLFCWAFGPTFGFVPIYAESVLAWIANLAALWLAGLVVKVATKRLNMGQLSSRLSQSEGLSRFLALATGLVLIPIIALGFIAALQKVGGITRISTDDFTRAFGTGLAAHARVLGMPIMIYLIGTGMYRSPLGLFVLGCLLLGALVYQVKGWILIPLLAGLIYRVEAERTQINLRVAVRLLALGVLVFFSAYLIGFGANDLATLTNTNTYRFLVRHFMSYMFAGILNFSELLRHGLTLELDFRLPFLPIVNIYNYLTGGPILSPIDQTYLVINPSIGATSNVHSMIGTLYMSFGLGGSLAFSGLLGLLLYSLRVWARKSGSTWLLVLCSFTLSALCFGWFEYYFWHLAFVEAAVFGLFLHAVVIFRRRTRLVMGVPE